jgi:hypothetical protein
MLKGMGGGAGKVLGWLWNVAIPAALKAAGNAGKALMEFFTGGMGRFVDTFPMIELPTTSVGDMFTGLFDKFLGPIMDWKIMPEVKVSVGEKDHDKPWYHWNRHMPGVSAKVSVKSLREVLAGLTWGIPDILGKIFSVIPGLNRLVKNGKVAGIPDLSKLFWPPGFMLKHAMSSFFPGKGGSATNTAGSMGGSTTGSTEQSSVTPQTDQEDAAGGITPTSDNSKGDDTVKGQGAAAASADASSISESASYDKKGGGGKGGIVPIPVGQMKGAGAAGGKGNAIIQTSVNKYEVINGFKKTMILAELYKG